MAGKNNAKCSICGADYHICRSCNDAIKLAPYKNFVDTPECYKVFQVVRGFNTGMYTKDEAKEKLRNVDLSSINLRPHIKETVDSILKEESFKKKNKKAIVEIVEPVVEAIEEIVETTEESVVMTTEESVEELANEYTEESVFK